MTMVNHVDTKPSRQSLAFDCLIDVPHEQERRTPPNRSQHEEKSKAYHGHVSEEEACLQQNNVRTCQCLKTI